MLVYRLRGGAGGILKNLILALCYWLAKIDENKFRFKILYAFWIFSVKHVYFKMVVGQSRLIIFGSLPRWQWINPASIVCVLFNFLPRSCSWFTDQFFLREHVHCPCINLLPQSINWDFVFLYRLRLPDNLCTFCQSRFPASPPLILACFNSESSVYFC